MCSCYCYTIENTISFKLFNRPGNQCAAYSSFSVILTQKAAQLVQTVTITIGAANDSPLVSAAILEVGEEET
jgi:hypothetical protein